MKRLILVCVLTVLVSVIIGQHNTIERLEKHNLSLQACNTTLEEKYERCKDELDFIYGTDWETEIKVMNENSK